MGGNENVYSSILQGTLAVAFLPADNRRGSYREANSTFELIDDSDVSVPHTNKWSWTLWVTLPALRVLEVLEGQPERLP